MFPATMDAVLAEWVNGRIASEQEFLERTNWAKTWGFPAELYMPLFRYCRETGVPMVGLNVQRSLVRAVGAGGWDSVPIDQREGITPALPSPLAYRRFIFKLTNGGLPDRSAHSPEDQAFDRFVRAQEVWDRAFATHIVRASKMQGDPLVVGIIGSGHLQFGGGVPWQLADLGMPNARVLITKDNVGDMPDTDAADAIFGNF